MKTAAPPFASLTDRNTRNAARTATTNAVSVIDNEKPNFNTLNLTKLENSDYLSMM